MKKRVEVGLHSSKEQMQDIGEELGLEGDALNNFRYALYELIVDLEVDMETGDYEIIKVY